MGTLRCLTKSYRAVLDIGRLQCVIHRTLVCSTNRTRRCVNKSRAAVGICTVQCLANSHATVLDIGTPLCLSKTDATAVNESRAALRFINATMLSKCVRNIANSWYAAVLQTARWGASQAPRHSAFRGTSQFLTTSRRLVVQ